MKENDFNKENKENNINNNFNYINFSQLIKNHLIKKLIIVVFIFTLLLAGSLPAAAQEIDPDVLISLQYRDAHIQDVVRTLALIADVNIIVDDTAQGEVTVQLDNVTFWEAFDHLLKLKDLDYYQSENLLIVATPERLEEVYFEVERELYTLEHLQAGEAQDILADILPGLNVQTIPDERRLILQGFDEQIQDAREFLVEIDTPRDREYEIISLREQSPEVVSAEVEALFPGLLVRPRPAAGDIIIQGRRDQIREAADFIDNVDVPDLDVERFYRARHVTARELADLVAGLYPEDRLRIEVHDKILYLEGRPEAVEDILELLEELDDLEKAKKQHRIRADYIDLEELREIVAEMEPELDLVTSAGERTLVLQGDEPAVSRALSLIEELDQPRRQVMIDVRIEEISHTDLRDRGVAPGELQNFNLIDIGYGNILPTDISISLPNLYRFLDDEVASRTLANPRLLALDGEEAEIIIADQVPVLMSEQVVDGQLVRDFEYEDVGITLEFPPTITRDDTITLEIRPEVSSLGPGVSPGDDIMPVIQTRHFENIISLRDGQTFAVGGLMQDEVTEEIRKLPFLSELPILGQFFQYRRHDEEETEIIIFITTQIVDISEHDDAAVQGLSPSETIMLDEDSEELDPDEVMDYMQPREDQETVEEDQDSRSDENYEDEAEAEQRDQDDAGLEGEESSEDRDIEEDELIDSGEADAEYEAEYDEAEADIDKLDAEMDKTFYAELKDRADWPETYEFEFISETSLSAAKLNEIYGTGIRSIDFSRQQDGSWEYRLKLSGEMVYQVQEGETLQDIADRSGLSRESILQASWLSPQEVERGSILVLPFK